MCHCFKETGSNGQGLRGRHRPGGETFTKRYPVNEFHRQIHGPSIRATLEERRDCRMLELCACSHFSKQSRGPDAGDIGPNELDGRWAIERQIPSLEDLPHASLANAFAETIVTDTTSVSGHNHGRRWRRSGGRQFRLVRRRQEARRILVSGEKLSDFLKKALIVAGLRSKPLIPSLGYGLECHCEQLAQSNGASCP